MQLAISGTELELGESIVLLIDGAKQVGVRLLEFWYPKNGYAEGVENSLALINEAGLQIICVASGSELYREGGSFKDQELLLETIELASRVGAKFVNTYFGYSTKVNDDLAIETYTRFLQPCLALAHKYGITIVLENEFNAFGVDHHGSDITRRPLSLLKLFKQVNDTAFRLNFDAANFYCAGVEPFPYAYYLLKQYIGYMHIKDCGVYDQAIAACTDLSGWRRFTDFEREFVTLPLGTGAVPWFGLLEQVRKDGYQGYLTLEPHSAADYRMVAWQQATSVMRQFLKV